MIQELKELKRIISYFDQINKTLSIYKDSNSISLKGLPKELISNLQDLKQIEDYIRGLKIELLEKEGKERKINLITIFREAERLSNEFKPYSAQMDFAFLDTQPNIYSVLAEINNRFETLLSGLREINKDFETDILELNPVDPQEHFEGIATLNKPTLKTNGTKPVKSFSELLTPSDNIDIEKLAEALKNEFKIEKGKPLRLVLEVLKDKSLFDYGYRENTAIYNSMKAHFTQDIGALTGILDKPVLAKVTKDSKDYKAIETRVLKAIKKSKTKNRDAI